MKITINPFHLAGAGQLLSSTAKYALRAVVYLAEHRQDEPLQVSVIADALGIPRNYLSKILHELARANVLLSARGKGGGFRIAATPEQISLLAVVEVFDQFNGNRRCLLGREECSDHSPCAAHGHWKTLSEEISTFFRETTVADLMGHVG
jgi:Rrf2 family protein